MFRKWVEDKESEGERIADYTFKASHYNADPYESGWESDEEHTEVWRWYTTDGRRGLSFDDSRVDLNGYFKCFLYPKNHCLTAILY